MWKRFPDIFVKIITFVQRNDALAKKVNEQEQEIEQLTDITQRLVFELQRLNDKLDHSTQRDALEREKLLLKIENHLLKANRQLPPADDDDQEKK